MPWVRLDEEFPDHPKVVRVGAHAMALQVAALCWSNRHLTDGLIPHQALRKLVDFHDLGEFHLDKWVRVDVWKLADRLVEAGMWTVVPHGFRIHDYEDYQPTRAEVEAERARNSKAGRLGAAARQAKRQHRAKRSAKQDAKQAAKRDVNASSTDRLAQVQPVPVPETPMVKGSGMGTVEGGSGGEASPAPSSATPSGDADAATPTPTWLRVVPDPQPRSREEQLAILERMAESENP